MVLVPPDRFGRWVENFGARRDGLVLTVAGGSLLGRADDGSHFTASLPFSRTHDGPADPAELVAATSAPEDWGVLLVRKGGFAVARLAGETVTDSKVGQRHVQGRTKAGGQSQQRFARRRDNQARVAYEAAAEHAVRIVGDAGLAVVGGDASAVAAVLEDDRLARLRDRVVGGFLTVPDPRRSVLEGACRDARAISVEVVNA